jgi:predicted MFS family arabinose efflux permease
MNYRFVVPLLTTAFLEQTVTATTRITTSYRAIELGLSVMWLGLITAAFAILPMVFALKIGRSIDRGHDARTAWIGGGLMVISLAGFCLWDSLLGLFISTALLGIAHLHLVISQQVLCTRQSEPGGMERMLGNYMVANAVGQGVGPYIIGWVGGAATVPPTDILFLIAFGCAVLTFAVSLLLRPTRKKEREEAPPKPLPVREIANIPGIRIVFFLSIVTVAAQDLIVVYFPVLGSERGMPVDTVGVLLAVRAVASMLSRFLFARLNQALGRWPLLITSTFAGAVCYASLALPLPLFLVHGSIAGAGFSLGIAVTGSIATLLSLASAEARGTANSLRMMGNRVGQFIIPFTAGLIAAATGAAGIFLVIGVSLMASGIIAQIRHAR